MDELIRKEALLQFLPIIIVGSITRL